MLSDTKSRLSTAKAGFAGKNLFLLFIAFLLLQLTTIAQEGWFEQTSGVTKKLLGVSFTDSNTGTAVGYDGTILRTTDGGVTWDSLSSGTTNDLWDVCFTDANTGTTVGEVGVILRTIDGGATWVSQSSGTMDLLFGVFFTDANTGTVVGGSGTILRTTDGGETWVLSNVSCGLADVFFTDVNTGTAVGGGILRTTDGGDTWLTLPIGTNNDFWGVCFTDANTGTVVGRGAIILRTTDGGVTWDSLSSGTTNDLWDVCFTYANTGTVVTGWGFGGDHGGEIIRTTDGGLTWTSQLSNYPSGLHGVSFTDANNGTAVGSDGTIFRTTNGGVSFIEGEEINEIPSDYRLTQNYPNPFNPSTKIKYQVPELSFVTLKVYDVLGSEIITLVNEEKTVGSYEVNFNAASLPSGVYFYQLKAGSFVETKKMMLMK